MPISSSSSTSTAACPRPTPSGRSARSEHLTWPLAASTSSSRSGAETWRSGAPGATPADLTPFRPVTGRDGRTAPATQHDVWLWITGAKPEVTWRSARGAVETVGGAVHVAAEQTAFTYHGGRDITGFVDGTANPPERGRARPARKARRGRQQCARDAMAARSLRVRAPSGRRAGARHRPDEARQRGVAGGPQAARRAHCARRDERGRPRARDPPAQRAVRDVQ